MREHLATPAHRLALQLLERHDRVDKSHLERLLASYWRHKNQISLAFFGPTMLASRPGLEAAVE